MVISRAHDIRPWAPFILSQCLLLVAHAIRPSPYRWMLWPVIASIICLSLSMLSPTYYLATTDAIRIIFLACIFIASDFILLTDVQRELHLANQRVPTSNLGPWDRLSWGLNLFFSTRGVGWNYEPKYVLPPHPRATRLRFLTIRFCELALRFFIADLANIFIRTNPFFAPESPPCVQQPWLWRIWGLCLFTISFHANVILVHTMSGMVCVGSGLSNPEMWPHIFGHWADAYTVRRFWGYDFLL